MQMSTFDTLSAFESLIATGITPEQAKAQTVLLAKAAAPDLSLKDEFEKIDKKFEGIDKKFDAIDKKFDAIDKKFDAIDRRFDTMDKKFELMDKDFFYVRWLGISIMISILGIMVTNFFK